MTPSLRVAATHTDNVFLSDDASKQSDWITQIVPGIAVRANRPRLRLDALYAPEIVYHDRTRREDKVFHRGNAAGTLELADDLLFLEAGGKVDQYDVSLRGPLTTSNVHITGNRTTAATAYAGPYLRRDIGSAARAEARLTYSTLHSDDDQRTLPDSKGRRGEIRLASRPAYRLLSWDVGYTNDSTEYDTGQQSTSEEIAASARGRIASTLNLLVSAGYERHETAAETLSEPRWHAGLDWTPTPRTGLAVTAGRRLDNESHGVRFSHRTRLTAWNLSYVEDVTTSHQQFLVPAQAAAGTPPEGAPAPTLAAPVNFFSNQLFLQKRWLASVALNGVRNTVIGTGFWEQREELVESAVLPVGDFAASQSIRMSGGSLAWRLRLTARTTSDVEIGRHHSEFVDSGRKDDFAYLRAGLSRQLQPRVSGSVYYRRQRQDSTQLGADYRENAVVASLLMTF